MDPLPEHYEPEFESLKDLLIEMSQERSLEALLQLIVRRFAQRPHMALARIWLIRPPDNCIKCINAIECSKSTACLHLAASAGRSIVDAAKTWTGINGKYSRLPMARGKIGRTAATGESLEIVDDDDGMHQWLDPHWIKQEQIKGFFNHALVYRGEILGVLAVFVRTRLPEEHRGNKWVRLVADQAASAIANANAFAEIDRLRRQLEMENAYLRAEVLEAREFHEIIGQSAALSELRKQIDMVAPTNASVLILGESGTGKELAAREIHKRSRRHDRPLIRVNCAAIPRNLYESEFFGHVKGAFTGAVKARSGRFELAHGGTLFLDEVGDIPLDLQNRLLRVLQEGQFERVGDEVTRQVDVRIIAASNRDLQTQITQGRFREDLFYRINVFPIEIAPLRKRKEDIPLLANHFIRLASVKLNTPAPALRSIDIQKLMQYEWPGNARELQNAMERAVITSRFEMFNIDLGNPHPHKHTEIKKNKHPKSSLDVKTKSELMLLERENILTALRKTQGRLYGPNGAAALIHMKPTTLASRIKKLGIKKTNFEG